MIPTIQEEESKHYQSLNSENEQSIPSSLPKQEVNLETLKLLEEKLNKLNQLLKIADRTTLALASAIITEYWTLVESD